jgi:hypothetical protein
MAHTINDPVITVTIPTTPSPTVLDLTDDCASVTFDGQRGVVSRALFGSAGQNRAVKGQVAVESFAPFDGGAGELATTTLTLPIHGLPDRVVTPES